MTTWTVRTPNWEVRRHDAEDFTVADDVLVLHMSDSDQPSVAAYAPGQWNSIERAAETPTVVDEHAQTLALIDALKTKLDELARRHASCVALKQAQEAPRNPPRSDAQGRPGVTHTGRGSDAPAKRTDGPWEMRTADGHTATYQTADRAHAAATTRGLLPSDYRVTRKDTAA